MQFANSACKVLKRETDTFCNSTKSYLSPLSKLTKVNGAPHANSVKLRRNCMLYSINLRQFAKRAQITFGAITKSISGLLFSFWTIKTELTSKICKYRKNNGCNSLHVQNWAPHANLPAETTNCMQHGSCFAITPGELKFKFANGGKIKKNPLTILDPYTRQGLSNQTTFRPI
jgi:hypothetical protein